MDVPKNFCQNCGHELDEGAVKCKRCNLVAAINLENFLISKYKLLAVIGVFAALSVYLSTTAISNGNNEFLRYGSYISLSIVILLSLIFGWEIIGYSIKILQFPFDGEYHYRDWFKLGFRFSTILLFISFFIVIIGFISFYILATEKNIATSLVLTILVDFLLFFIISTFYFPTRSLIESGNNLFRLIVVFSLIFLQFLTIKLYFLGHTEDVFALLMPIFIIVIAFVLIIRSSWLILLTMDNGIRCFTTENLKKMRSLWQY
jgi:hypothetical protein